MPSRPSPPPGQRKNGHPAGRLHRAAAVLLLAVVPLLAGCSDIAYYWQAGEGQWEIITSRRPIEAVLKDNTVDAQTKDKLRLILEAQQFATTRLALPSDGQYRYYTDLHRPYVSWLVVASEPLAIKEHEFCYLIVGCLGYRGYFDKAAAEEEAAALAKLGYDVLVRPVQAYSTLGWFDDPVLNTFLREPELELVGTIFHEQAHRRYFLKGDTAFNESFATCVQEVGLRRFIMDTRGGDPHLLHRLAAYRADRKRFRQIVLRGRARLEALYASDLPEAEKRIQKARLFDRMRQDYQNERNSFTLLNYDYWFAQPLNNAYLVGFGQYTKYVAGFRALLEQEHGDFAHFYRAVEALGALPRAEREARLTELGKRLVAATDQRQH